MKRPETGASAVKPWTTSWAAAFLLFAAMLLILLGGVFLPGHTLFSNDGPLAELMAQCHRVPGRFSGCWLDLGGVGLNGGSAPPNISFGLQWLLGPLWFSRLYAMVSLLILGSSAWCFFHQLRLGPLACVSGGMAAILNSTFFSVACWGMSPHVLAAAMSFLALAALVDNSPRHRWLRVILAGFAVGMGVAEGADVGAIFSLYVAAFIVYQAWTAKGPRVKNLAVAGLGRLVVVTLCAAFFASQAISALVNTSIKGIVQARQDTQSTTQRWNWATQWSLPKKEALSLVVPGLFGYRMDTPDGGNYWGKIGRDPAWDEPADNGSQPQAQKGFIRYAGGGYYEGVLVAMVALWVALESFRRGNSVFNLEQRKWLWFWLGAAIVSLLLAFGRFAPFYRLLYALPYFSAIRNPVKFLYPFSFALVIFFAFGVDGLQRKYMSASGETIAPWGGLKSWWSKAAKLEKFWVYGCVLVVVMTVAGWVVFAHERTNLENYMRSTEVPGDLGAIVSFSIHRIGWFLLFFVLSAGLMVLIFSGAFMGKRAKAGVILLGLLMAVDLGLANRPWIVYWDYNDKYASNPIIDILRDKPYEHRVAMIPIRLPPQEAELSQLYQIQWLQQQFPFYNIQSFETVEMPRMPEDISAFEKACQRADASGPFFRLSRAWQLSNTRYIFAPVNFLPVWNRQSYLAGTPLEIAARFALVPKPGVTKVTNVGQITATPTPTGRFALLEFTNALPRARLYGHWQVDTNDEDALRQLFSPDFNPEQSVLVDSDLPSDASTETNDAPAGTVEYLNYAPKDLMLKADASASSVLLLNDHFDPNWKVLVDGKPARLLRCNFLMRGVQLAPGTHQVEFKFQPSYTLLYVSLTANGLGLLMLGMLLAPNKNEVKVASHHRRRRGGG